MWECRIYKKFSDLRQFSPFLTGNNAVNFKKYGFYGNFTGPEVEKMP